MRDFARRTPLRRLRLWPPPLHTILLAAFPVLFLFAQNPGEVSVREASQSLWPALAWGAIALVVCGVLFLLDFRRGALVASIAILFWFTYGHVANLAQPYTTDRTLLVGGWLIVALVILALAIFSSDRVLGGVTIAVNVAAIALVAMSAFQLAPVLTAAPASAAVPHQGGTPVPGDRDIYYFIFDRYGSETSIANFAGVVNPLPGWLESRGFYVAHDSHANYSRTTTSLAATLGMNYITVPAQRMGPLSTDLNPLYTIIQRNPAGAFLQSRGYSYIHIGSWFGPTQRIAEADQNPRVSDETDFTAILDQTTFNPVLKSLLPHDSAVVPKSEQIHIDNALFQFREIPRMADEPSPRFVFEHVLLPHPPYVFTADGTYPSEAEKESWNQATAFEQQLTFTNEQIERVVDGLLAVPDDRKPIIVIQADEGMYPARYEAAKDTFDWSTATPEELETKFGILNAMYLPGVAPAGAPEPYPTISSVNSFRLLFDRYYGQSLPLLPDITYGARGFSHVYDQVDVTALLPSLQAGWVPPVAADVAGRGYTSAGSGEDGTVGTGPGPKPDSDEGG